jgi:hypothetical protein
VEGKLFKTAIIVLAAASLAGSALAEDQQLAMAKLD